MAFCVYFKHVPLTQCKLGKNYGPRVKYTGNLRIFHSSVAAKPMSPLTKITEVCLLLLFNIWQNLCTELWSSYDSVNHSVPRQKNNIDDILGKHPGYLGTTDPCNDQFTLAFEKRIPELWSGRFNLNTCIYKSVYKTLNA